MKINIVKNEKCSYSIGIISCFIWTSQLMLFKSYCKFASVLSQCRCSTTVVYEHSEVKVYVTGVFENCPDKTLTDDYYVSL